MFRAQDLLPDSQRFLKERFGFGVVIDLLKKESEVIQGFGGLGLLRSPNAFCHFKRSFRKGNRLLIFLLFNQLAYLLIQRGWIIVFGNDSEADSPATLILTMAGSACACEAVATRTHDSTATKPAFALIAGLPSRPVARGPTGRSSSGAPRKRERSRYSGLLLSPHLFDHPADHRPIHANQPRNLRLSVTS